MANKLYYGDNLDVLRAHVADESIDLIYLDPPFNSNASYNILFKSPAGQGADASVEAFNDTWRWLAPAEAAFHEVMRSNYTDVAELLRTMRSFLRDSDLMAYLAMMAVRLIELHRVLKSSGSVYLHCDPTASHYLKLLLDGVFGAGNFRSEIIWKRTGTHSSANRWGPVHDTIFYYSKTEIFTWNRPYAPHDKDHQARHYRHKDGDNRRYAHGELTAPGKRNGRSGVAWRGFDVAGIGRHWMTTVERLDKLFSEGRIYFPEEGGWPRLKRYEDEGRGGRAIGDNWTDIAPINMRAKERLGYPTQKPLALLERIIAASSNPGDVVLDPFCGCGTALEAAQKLGRNWTGIDITHLAIHLIEKRLHAAFGDSIDFETEGRPKDLASAQELARRDKHEFQKWITTYVGGVPWRAGRKGADGGIDGIINFDGYDPTAERPASTKAIISVKGGHQRGVGMVAELVEVIGRENAAVGILLMAANPTREMEARAAAAGFYDLGPHGRFPRIQIITLAEVFQGRRPALPNIDRTLVGKAAKPADPRSPKLL